LWDEDKLRRVVGRRGKEYIGGKPRIKMLRSIWRRKKERSRRNGE
jgi:hypothetical protein